MAERIPWDWPPHMQAAYEKWLAENENTCLCLNCLQERMRRADRKFREDLMSGAAAIPPVKPEPR